MTSSYERIKQMSVEEMAEFIQGIQFKSKALKEYNATDVIVQWLKRESEAENK